METVVARFHHVSRNPDKMESELVECGAEEAAITGYTVALTFDARSHKDAAEAAKRILDKFGATGIKITKHGAKRQKLEV